VTGINFANVKHNHLLIRVEEGVLSQIVIEGDLRHLSVEQLVHIHPLLDKL